MPAKLYNLHEYRRLRIELPTGRKVKRNGEEIEELKAHIIVGKNDAISQADLRKPENASKQVQNNWIELTAEQLTYAKESAALKALASGGHIRLRS